MPCMTITPPNTSFSFSSICDSWDLSNILNLPDGCCLDVLNLVNNLFKISAYLISPSLTSLFNFSLCSSQLPTEWKRALVTPVYVHDGHPYSLYHYQYMKYHMLSLKISQLVSLGVPERSEEYSCLFCFVENYRFQVRNVFW